MSPSSSSTAAFFSSFAAGAAPPPPPPAAGTGAAAMPPPPPPNLHILAKSVEERLHGAAGGLDEGVEALLRDVQARVLEDHRRVAAEELVLLGLRDLGGRNLRHF